MYGLQVSCPLPKRKKLGAPCYLLSSWQQHGATPATSRCTDDQFTECHDKTNATVGAEFSSTCSSTTNCGSTNVTLMEKLWRIHSEHSSLLIMQLWAMPFVIWLFSRQHLSLPHFSRFFSHAICSGNYVFQSLSALGWRQWQTTSKKPCWETCRDLQAVSRSQVKSPSLLKITVFPFTLRDIPAHLLLSMKCLSDIQILHSKINYESKGIRVCIALTARILCVFRFSIWLHTSFNIVNNNLWFNHIIVSLP